MSEVSQPNELMETIEKALKAATPGPWKGKHAIKPYITVFTGVVDEVIATVEMRNNLQLLSNAPEWLRALLEDNKKLRSELEELKGVLIHERE